MDIDWGKFSERVPLNTLIKGHCSIEFRSLDNYTWYNAQDKCGIVMRLYRETGDPLLTDGMVCQMENEIAERSVPVKLVKYFIEERWKSFEEVMA